MYNRSIKLMFITQTNDFGSVIWKKEQQIGFEKPPPQV